MLWILARAGFGVFLGVAIGSAVLNVSPFGELATGVWILLVSLAGLWLIFGEAVMRYVTAGRQDALADER